MRAAWQAVIMAGAGVGVLITGTILPGDVVSLLVSVAGLIIMGAALLKSIDVFRERSGESNG